MRPRLRLLAIATIGVIVAAPAAVSAKSESRASRQFRAAPRGVVTPAAKGSVDSVTWAVYRETNSLDPIVAFDYPENTAITPLCDALLRQEPDGTIGAGLATAITTLNPTTYRIALRKGVKFWDGSPLTAADVVFSLKRAADPKAGGFYAAAFDRVTSITAKGTLAVTIRLSKPDYQLRGELSSMPGVVVEKRFAKAKGKDFGTVKAGTMCTGPFKLASWKTGEGVTMVANPHYWDRTLIAKVKKLIIKGVPDETAVTSGLLTGELSGNYALQLSTLDKLRKSSAVHVYEGPSYASDAFIVSSLKGTLKDVRVRRALSLAIDRQGIVDAVYKGAAAIPHALANTGTYGYAPGVLQAGWDALPALRTNLDEAKKLVKEAGAQGKTIRLGTSSELVALNTEASSVKSAADSIGLKAELVSTSAANYINFFIDAKARAKVDGFFTINYPDYADPAALYGTLVLANGSQNYSGYANPTLTALMEKARSTADDAKRAALVVEAQKIITSELPWIPIVAPTTVLIMSSKITGAPSSFQYMFGPWAARLGSAG